ncbi:hypothetical protein ACHAWF_010796 [Thalassiosira exigua]
MSNEPGDCCRAIVTMEISSVTELASAQQRMRVVSVSKICVHRSERCDCGLVAGGKVRRLSISVPWSECSDRTSQSTPRRTQQSSSSLARIIDALHRGKNRLVVREWRQGACWWNLNMNRDSYRSDSEGNGDTGLTHVLRGGACREPKNLDQNGSNAPAIGTTLSMARAEVAGYRLARAAMDSCNGSEWFAGDDGYHSEKDNGYHSKKRSPKKVSCDVTSGGSPPVFMPEVLYFSHDDDCISLPSVLNLPLHENESIDVDPTRGPWALLSYFDNGSDDSGGKLAIDLGCSIHPPNQPSGVLRSNEITPLTRDTEERIPCFHYPTTMTKIRHEFGFNEPHPRHGRVPSDECLGYAMMILRDVILPIQGLFFVLGAGLSSSLSQINISKSKQAFANNLLSLGWGFGKAGDAAKSFQYHDMINVYRHALHRLSMTYEMEESRSKKDGRMNVMLNMLDKCIDALSCEWDGQGGKPPLLPPVLCHMDLQPQNISFWHSKQLTNGFHKHCVGGQLHNHNSKGCSVASVMDWEEACYADPRFELLLVCRKVLANREQAQKLWACYAQNVQRLSSLLTSQSEKPMNWHVGPLEPWLKLETVHSLCTLLLQAMNLLGGGRSPWETKPDLWGKIDRERQRLVQMGWAFCDTSA